MRFSVSTGRFETKEKYVEALINEIKLNKNKMSEYVVDTVFIGGGTPSLLEENQISKSCQF